VREKSERTWEGRGAIPRGHQTQAWQTTRRGSEEVARTKRNSLVLLQVNCNSILNKPFGFWNLIYTYNPNDIIGTKSLLREEITNVEVFRDDCTTLRRDRNTQGGGVFICITKLHLLLGIMGGRGTLSQGHYIYVGNCRHLLSS
jgi:hypothetical protein